MDLGTRTTGVDWMDLRMSTGAYLPLDEFRIDGGRGWRRWSSIGWQMQVGEARVESEEVDGRRRDGLGRIGFGASGVVSGPRGSLPGAGGGKSSSTGGDGWMMGFSGGEG